MQVVALGGLRELHLARTGIGFQGVAIITRAMLQNPKCPSLMMQSAPSLMMQSAWPYDALYS